MPSIDDLKLDPALKELAERFVESAKQQLQLEGKLDPCILLLGPGGVRAFIPDFSDAESKKLSFQTARQILSEIDGTVFVSVCEAWAAKYQFPDNTAKEDIKALIKSSLVPSKSKDREEVILFALGTPGHRFGCTIPFFKNPNGVVSFKPANWLNNMKGPFTDLFSPLN